MADDYPPLIQALITADVTDSSEVRASTELGSTGKGGDVIIVGQDLTVSELVVFLATKRAKCSTRYCGLPNGSGFLESI